MNNPICKKVYDAINDTVVSIGYEIVDIEYSIKGGQQHLCIFIYNQDGIGLDDCEKVSKAVDSILDELDPTNGRPYNLDVSSPGLDRPFISQRDFERNYNKKVEIKLNKHIDKKNVLVGILLEKNNENIIIELEEKQIIIPIDCVLSTTLYIDFSILK